MRQILAYAESNSRLALSSACCAFVAVACGGTPKPLLTEAADCSVRLGRLPACTTPPRVPVLSVGEVVEARSTQPAWVRGRLVIGAQCVAECLTGLFPGLASEEAETALPSGGPLLLLTSEQQRATGFPFQDSLMSLQFPGHCARRGETYCCGFPISGQRVLIAGRGVEPPKLLAATSTAPGTCSRSDELRSLPSNPVPGLPRCRVTAGWRKDIDEIWGFAAESACELPAL